MNLHSLYLLASTGLVGFTRYLQSWLHFIEELDPQWAPLAFITIYVTAAVLFAPGSIITLAAGILFGVGWGSVYVSVASIIGASLSFLIGRYLARDWVRRKLDKKPKFAAIDEAIGREGSKIVFLLRLSPIIPFSLLNYGLGITRISFGKYVTASWFGMLPGTILYVYIGSLFKNIADLVSGGREKTSAEWSIYALGLIATILATVYITQIAKKAIHDISNKDSQAHS